MRRVTIIAFKLVVFATCLGLIARMIDPDRVVDLLVSAEPVWLAVAGVLAATNVALDALLFMGIMSVHGHSIGWGRSIAITIVGGFFNNLTPASVGQDIVRGAQMRRAGASLWSAGRVIVNQRLMSMLALAVVIAAGVPISISYLGASSKNVLLVVFGAGSLVGIAVLALSSVQPDTKSPAWLRAGLRPVKEIAADLFRSAVLHRSAGANWLAASGQHLIRVLIFVSLARALQIEVGAEVLFAFAPLSLLIAMVPISLGSWGVRELSLVYFLGWAGVATEAALVLSLAFGMLRLLFGIAGGVALLITRRSPHGIGIADKN